MDAYNVPIHEAIVRYLGMMALIIIGVFTGWWVLALLALPLFLTALTGMCPVKRLFQNDKKHRSALTVRRREEEAAATAKAA